MRYYCLESKRSPTHFNLSYHCQQRGWKASYFSYKTQLNQHHLDFPQDLANLLEYKHLLAQLLYQYHGDWLPQTYVINDSNWPLILSQLSANTIWILKPALLNNGVGIKLFDSIDELEAHFLSAKRFGGPHVIQQYIADPHLLKGHKYSVRMLIVITLKAAFIYSRGYFNVAGKPYEFNNITDLSCHITNEHLLKDQSNVIQIPSERFDFFSEIYPKIKAIAKVIWQSLSENIPLKKTTNQYAFFGFDFLVDSCYKVWFIEANHGPCFPIDQNHPLQTHLYNAFWQDFIENFIELHNDNPVKTCFEIL